MATMAIAQMSSTLHIPRRPAKEYSVKVGQNEVRAKLDFGKVMNEFGAKMLILGHTRDCIIL